MARKKRWQPDLAKMSDKQLAEIRQRGGDLGRQTSVLLRHRDDIGEELAIREEEERRAKALQKMTRNNGEG